MDRKEARGFNAVKMLSAAFFCGLCVLADPVAAYATEDETQLTPVLDEHSGSIIPGTDTTYIGSEYTLTEYFPTDVNNLPENVIKYYDPNNLDAEVHYYQVNFKHSEYGEGASERYFKWATDSNGVKLVVTDNKSEAVITLKYNPNEAVKPITVAAGEKVSNVSNNFIAQDIKGVVDTKGEIDGVTSKFIGNTMEIGEDDGFAYSAVLSEYDAAIHNVNSSFIGNTINVNAGNKIVLGTLVKSLSVMDNIYSEFIGNTVNAKSAVSGGLVQISSAGDVKDITSDFIKNSVISTNAEVNGAILNNEGLIEKISSRFSGNYGVSDSGNINGGAIYNSGNVGINGSTFNANYVKSNSGKALGGAIHNKRGLTVENSIFRDNYAETATGKAQGGAIYSDMDITVKANDGKLTEFTGNYIKTNGVIENQAIYIDSDSATLTLNATNNGTILMNDNIDGADGYSVSINGDETGRVKLFGDINNANVLVSGTNLDLINSDYHNYNFGTLASNESAKYHIDLNFGEGKADTFTVGAGSSGVIYISELNQIGQTPIENTIVQILNAPDTIRIELSQGLVDRYHSVTMTELEAKTDTVMATSLWSDEYFKHNYREITTKGIRTAIKDATRNNADSIEYYVEKQTEEYKTESLGDTLALMSSKSGARNFKAKSDEDIYIVKDNVGNVASGTLAITGVKYNDNYSKINADGHTLFEFGDGSGDLSISTLDIINSSTADGSVINNKNATSTVNLTHVAIDSASENAIINDGKLKINHRFTTNSGIKGTGTVEFFSSNEDQKFTNGASIIQDMITINIGNNHKLILDKDSIISGTIRLQNGYLEVYADNLLGDATLTGGHIRLYDGTLTSTISGAGGSSVYIDGDIKLANTISTLNLYMVNDATLTTSADNLKMQNIFYQRNVDETRGTINLTGGALENIVLNNQNIDINILGEVDLKNNTRMVAPINITENGILNFYNTAPNGFGGSYNKVNDGVLNIYGEHTAYINGNLSGSGALNIFGSVHFGNLISQDSIHVMEGGNLSIHPGAVDTPIWNDSVLTLRYSAAMSNLTQKVYGKGYIEIVDKNNISIMAPIEQQIKVRENASFNFYDIDNLHGAIHNDGTLNIHKSTNGPENPVLTQNITGTGSVFFHWDIQNQAHITASQIIPSYYRGLYSNADLLHGDIKLNHGHIYLTGGTLNHSVGYYASNSGGYFYIGTPTTPAEVTINAPFTTPLVVNQNSSATTSLENIGHNVTLYTDSNLYLKGDGVLTHTINRNGKFGTLNILGNLSTKEYRIDTSAYIHEGGSLTTDMSLLTGGTSDTKITNEGDLYISGKVNRIIYGNGTTHINDSIELYTTGSAENPLFQNLDLNKGTLKIFGDNPRSNNYLGTVTNEGTLDLKLALSSSTVDSYILNKDSNAIFNIGELNIRNYTNKRNGQVYQVLKGESSAQLALDWHDFTIDEYESKKDTITSTNVYFDDEFNIQQRTGVTEGNIELATTQTENDSIKLTYNEIQWNDWETERADLLSALNQYSTSEIRNFNFKTSSDNYVVLEKLGITTNGKFNINGVADEDGNRSTIDMNGFTGFVLQNHQTNFNISNTAIKNSSNFALKLTNPSTIGTIGEDGSIEGGIINSSFSNNTHARIEPATTEIREGVVSLTNGKVSQIKDSEFSNNKTTLTNNDKYFTPSAHGAGLHMHGNNVTIGSKEHNTGGIFNTKFENNSITLSGQYISAGHGAGLYVGGTAYISNLKDSVIKNNIINSENSGFGAGLYTIASTINNIENLKVLNNEINAVKSSYGAGIYLNSNSNIGSIKDSYFSGNSAISNAHTSNGGALYTVNSSTIGSITNTIFENNFATNGSAIYGTLAIGEIDNCQFINNKAEIGGTVYMTLTQSGTIKNTLFQNNSVIIDTRNEDETSRYSSGNSFIIQDNKELTLDNVTFDNNLVQSDTANNTNSSVYGGALQKHGYGDLNINNAQFTNNRVTGSSKNLVAGALALRENNNRLYGNNIIKNSLFENNSVENTIRGQAVSTGALFIGNSGDSGHDANVEISNTDFINNRVINNQAVGTYVSGGAIYISNSKNSDSVTISGANFDNNYVLITGVEDNATANWGRGGAIHIDNSAKVDRIENSTFKNNYVQLTHLANNNGSTAVGGAITINGSAIINVIQNTVFENNHVSSSKNAYGGALDMQSTLTEGIINCTFKNNYASGGNTNNQTRGGAISAGSNDLKITAKDSFVSEFSGNYIMAGDDESTKISEAIFMNRGYNTNVKPVLTLNAETNGQILMKDAINGYNYKLELTGDGTGSIVLHNDIKRYASSALDVIANNTSIDMAEGTMRDFNFTSLNTEDSAKWALDIDFANKTADNFTLGKGSSGILMIDNLNVLNNSDEVVTVQILNLADTTDDLQLALDSSKINVQENLLLTLSDTNYNDVVYHQNAGYSVGTTKTLNDSIIQHVDKDYDGLNIISASTLNTDRYFVFRNNNAHVVTEDFDVTAQGSLTIQGVAGSQITSVIDANGHSLFNLGNDTKLNLSNVRLTGNEDLIYVNSPKAAVNMNNAIIDGNIKGANNYNIDIAGDASAINGIVENARTTLNSGDLSFSENTFAASNDSLILAGGDVKLDNGNVENYIINELTTSDDVGFSLDFDLANHKIDTITTKSNKSNGIINISNINYISDIANSDEFVVQVLNTNKNSNLSLALDENLNYYTVKEISRSEVDDVVLNTDFSHVYYNRTRNGVLYGELYLTTTSTTNDSLGFRISEKWETSTTPTTSLGDTLKLVNQSTLSARNFNSSQATDVYTLHDALGKTAQGTLSINGTTDGEEKSTVNLNNFDGFDIGKDTVFNVNNTKITGTEDIITVTDSSAQVNLNNAYIDGNIVGQENYNLNISGLGTTTINGLISNANVAATRGTLAFGENTFADNSTNVTFDAVSVNLRNDKLENYNIANLNSTSKARYYLDINLETQQADTITANGSGVIVLDGFNILGALKDVDINSKIEIQILKTNSNNLELQLSESILSQLDKEYLLGTSRINIGTDEVKNVTSWKDEYHQIEQDFSTFGRLNLDSKITKNDSLSLNQLQVKEGDKYYILDDTLKLFCQTQMDDERRFVFDTANDRYNLTQNIGTVSEGVINIEGVTDTNGNLSAINMNSKTGFGLSNENILNISNIKFENINNRDGSLLNISNSETVVNLDNVTVDKTESANAIVNAGTINMNGGNVILNSGIKGAGTTNITGSDVTLTDNVSITQKEVNVANGSLTLSDSSIINGILNIGTKGSATVTTGAFTSAVSNDGALNIFSDGTLSYNITGSGKTNINGHIINEAKISQNVDVQSGSLTTAAENIEGKINNNAIVTINGTLSSVIAGNGTTYVKDNLTLAENAGIIGTLDLNNGNISTNDGNISDYSIGKMVGTGKFDLDIDVLTKTSDKFIVGTGSNGTVYIDNINLKNADSFDSTFKVQIIDSTDGSIKLALNEEIGKVDYKIGQTSRNEQDTINSVTNYKTNYLTYVRNGDIYGNLVLGTTSTENDSIVINTKDTVWADNRTTTGTLGDSLVLWNTLDTTDDKEFVIDKVDTYTVSSIDSVTGIGETKGQNVTVSGVSQNETSKSAINFNNKTGFELVDNTNLNINNTKLMNAKDNVVIAVSNKDAVVNLNNAYIEGNISGSENTNINISGNSVTTLNGKVSDASVNLNEGGLKFNTNTFEGSDTALNVNGGNVNLDNDGKIEKYIINELHSDKDARYSIDIDLQNQLSDIINVKSGSGIITIDNLNIKGSPENVNKDYKIQILDVEAGDLQLALTTNAQDQLGHEEYLIGTHTEIIEDSIKEVTNFKDVYEKYTQTTYTYGTLSLVSTKTENDSIGIKVSKTVVGDKILEGTMGDTLKLVNNSEKIANKTFEFNTSEDVYNTTENLGKTNGTLNITGAGSDGKYSTIEMNQFSGFELGENSELNISNTEIKNAESESGSVIFADTSESKISLENVSIKNNKSRGEHGGAIYSKSDISISAKDGKSTISGNKTAIDDEAVYLGENATLALNAVEKGEITIDDKINGENSYAVKMTGDETGKIYLNNKISNANVEMENITLHISSDKNFETSNFTINSGTLDLINGQAQQQLAQSFNITGSFNLNADVDLAKAVMDRLPENATINSDAFINVNRLNLISDTTKQSVAIPFAHEQIKDNVKYIGAKELSKDTQITAFAPIYKYSVKYENRDDLGYFVFTNGSGGSQVPTNPSNNYNPAVLATPVTAQAGTYNVINQTLGYAFEHADTFTLLPAFDRAAILSGNKYAMHSDERLSFNETNKPEIWFHPFATFESIPLKNGPKVNTTTYGSLAGGDSELKQLRHGWSTVTTVYAGYNGSSQNYSGVSTYQNGGILGATQTWYKGNFFTALTATAGASVGESHTMYGSEDFTTLLAGVASKSGYNYDFANGKYTIQPSMLLSYSFINTFDYTNAAGVRIDSSPLHIIQMRPNLRFIVNAKNGWQPYASVGMVWNVLDDAKVTANDVRLPGMSVKPYVEYGLGIQKRWAERFTAYGQAMVRSGGRNGISLNMGFRWAIGNEGKPIEKVRNQSNTVANTNNNSGNNKKIIKHL